MKRMIRASKETYPRKDYFIHPNEMEDQNVYDALVKIFEPYGLVVDYLPGSGEYPVHPEGWPWPYKYCRSIKFGGQGNNAVVAVPLSYKDGYNTTLPQSAIDKVVRSADKAKRIVDDYRVGWPSNWKGGSRSGTFIESFFNYADDEMTRAEHSLGLERYFPYMLPEASFDFSYKSLDNDEIIWSTTYGKWLDLMYKFATSSATRNEFIDKYEDYLTTMLNNA